MRSGVDVLNNPQTTIEGLHYVSYGIEVLPNLAIGQGFYSSAFGDAGGAFFWGYELSYNIPLNRRLSLYSSLFLGGGGGAYQVGGDGFMSRPYSGLRYGFSDSFSLDLGISHVRITGAPISDWALSGGINYAFGGDDWKIGAADYPRLCRAALRSQRMLFTDSKDRDGHP